jgi:predicted Ser/Thr protein kinase/tetratricopeptide (TPR) repeat protein
MVGGVERIGRYEVVRELGAGAMGRVFLARDPSLERSVALKLLATASEGARARFHDEAKALAALSHPGIVTIFEVSEHDGQDFIAMEYLAGRTLRELLLDGDRRERRAELIAICGKVATAVDAAHRAGILHRDIKPENVIVSDSGGVKVVDFGIARRMFASDRITPLGITTPVDLRIEELLQTFATMRVGTPAYMAPEVLIGETSTEASDVYSLGVVLYECLAGRRPYEQGSLVELIAVVIDGSQRPDKLDDSFAELVERMLAREPEARPKLSEIAAALTTRARTAPASPRVRRWPVVAGACAVVAGGAIGWQLMRRGSVPPTPAAPPVLAIEAIQLAISDDRAPPGTDDAMANAIATIGSSIEGVKVVGPDDVFTLLKLSRRSTGPEHRSVPAAQLFSAERELGATLVARGKIDARAGRIYAHLEITRLIGIAAPIVIERDAPAAELPKLELDLGEQVARAVNPDARLALGANNRLARALTTRGEQSIKDSTFYDAVLYLEPAVLADPKLFDAWNTLALAREWKFAPEEDVKQAVDHARALAPDDISRQLLTGISQYLDRDFRAALVTLAPLEAQVATLGDQQKHDLYYYLGETHWHAGRQSKGVDYFRRVLDIDPRFSPAAIHPAEFAVARRDAATSRALAYLQGTRQDDSTEFSIGHYEKLASRPGEWNLSAQIVLGRPTTFEPPNSAIGTGSLRLARAVEAGDRPAMQRAIAEVWAFIDAQGPGPMPPGQYYALQMFGEVLICANLVDDMKKLVDYLAKSSKDKAVGGYPRMQLLAAPLLHDKSLVVHDYYTDRLTKLADASDAELAGNRARSVALLRELVNDPSPFWDYPERAALIRNLRALGKTKEADAVCADTMKPAIFRVAFMPVRKLCTSRGSRTSGTAKASKKR